MFDVATGARLALEQRRNNGFAMEASSPSAPQVNHPVRFLDDGRVAFSGWNTMEVWDWRAGRPWAYASFMMEDWTTDLSRALHGSLLIDLHAPLAVDEFPGSLLLLSPTGAHVVGQDDGSVVLYQLAEGTASRTAR